MWHTDFSSHAQSSSIFCKKAAFSAFCLWNSLLSTAKPVVGLAPPGLGRDSSVERLVSFPHDRHFAKQTVTDP